MNMNTTATKNDIIMSNVTKTIDIKNCHVTKKTKLSNIPDNDNVMSILAKTIDCEHCNVATKSEPSKIPIIYSKQR
jgi:hypothetical protein